MYILAVKNVHYTSLKVSFVFLPSNHRFKSLLSNSRADVHHAESLCSLIVLYCSFANETYSFRAQI